MKAIKDKDKVDGLYFSDVQFEGYKEGEDNNILVGEVVCTVAPNAAKEDADKDKTDDTAKEENK